MKHAFILITTFILCSFLGYSQVTTLTTVLASDDSQTNSASGTQTAGSANSMKVQVISSGATIFRSFVKFTLPSIPAGSVISSARLRVYPTGTENVTAINGTEVTVEACNSAWTEASINYNANIVSNSFVSGVSISNLASGKREFELRDHVQAMIDGRIPNNGWLIRRSSETTTASTAYLTKEGGKSPELIISYYTRPSVTAAIIIHTSTLTSTDGSISPTVTGGSSATMNYRWFNSSGTQIGTSQNLQNVGKGWYGLKFYGSVDGDTTYQAFIVGTECETTTISFNPGPNYMDDAQLSDRITGSGSTAVNSGQANNSTVNYIMDERWTTGTWNNERGLMRFRLWIDPNCQVNTANLLLTGNSHNPSQITNASELLKVTSGWFESNVSNNIAPTSTVTGKINIAGVAAGNSNVTVDLASFFNAWKTNNTTNYGLLFQLQSYTANANTRMQFHSSDATTANNRPQITFSITTNTCDLSRKGAATVTYVAANDNYADISTTITPPSWAVSPYHYMISEEPIPSYSNIYRALQYGDPIYVMKDTFLIDSTTFFNVGETALTKSFEAIEPGQYFISVFDKLGTRIYDKQVSVSPISYEVSSGIAFSNDEFTTTAAGGKALLYSFINESSEGASITFTISNNSGESWFGLLNTSSGLTSKTNLVHGFTVGSGMASIVAGGSSGSAFSVSPTDQFTITKEGSNMKFYVNGVYKTSAVLPTAFTYKVGLLGGSGDAGAAGVRIKYKPVKLISLRRAWNTITQIVPGSCMGSFGNITGTLNSFTFFTASMINPSTVLTSVATGLPQTMDASGSATNYSFSNLLPGTYTLTNTFYWSTSPSVPVTFTTTVFVSSRIAWENMVNSTDVPSGSMISTTPVHGHATSINKILTSGNSYVDFGVSLAGYVLYNLGGFYFMVPSGTGFASIGFYNPAATTISTPIPYDFTGYRFYKTGLSPFVITKYVGGTFQGIVATYTGNSRFRFVYDKSNDQGSLYRLLPNGNLGTLISGSTIQYTTSIPFEVNKLMTYLNTNFTGRGFTNISTNMQCPADIIYAKLERQLLGVKYKVNLNKFYFFYDEEYASTAKLIYNVYDKNNNIVLKTATQNLANPSGNVGSNGIIINREYADNRYSLDVSSLAAGSYVLEVINEKDEKLYLRFIK